ncbi:MAG: hypothetical protein RQ739_09905 [Desulfotignum sp.]|nr:hypothetical protein [Desulfotignum sp.]
MTDNYGKIVQNNLKKLYDPVPPDLDQRIAAIRDGHRFMPIDSLADVGEYTSKKIIELIA